MAIELMCTFYSIYQSTDLKWFSKYLVGKGNNLELLKAITN